MRSILNAILIILVLATWSLAVLIAPESAGLEYWLSVLWITFLIFLNWGSSAGLFQFSQHQVSETGSLWGSLPSISILIFLYSLFSVALVVASNWLNILSSSIHAVLQITSLAIVASISLVILFAAKAQQQGSYTKVSKSQLLEQTRRVLRGSSSEEVKQVALQIQSYIAHSMPHPRDLNQEALLEVHEAMADLEPNDVQSIGVVHQRIKML